MGEEKGGGAMERKNNYISMGVTAFLTAAAVLLFYDTLFGGKAVTASRCAPCSTLWWT